MIDLPACALIGASAADLMTTELGLANGAYEANPLMQHRAVRVGGKVLATAVVLGASHELEKRGKKRAAKVLKWTMAGVWAGAAAWNLSQTRRSW